MSTQGDGMAEVTEADREKARELRSDWMTFRAGDGNLSIGMKEEADHVEAIAAALAEEREKARAPFLALAEEAERKGVRSSFRDFAGNPWPAHIYPHDIRRAAEVTE